MNQWAWRLERAQLLLLPMLVGIVGVLQALSHSRLDPLPRFELAVTLLALTAPLLAWFLMSCFWRDIDVLLLAVTAMLTNVSMVLLYAAAHEVTSSSSFFEALATRQAIFIAAGYAALMLGASVAQHLGSIGNYPYTIAIGALLLTATTMLLGTAVNGARLWLELGPLRFQPGELSRLLLTSFIAIYLFSKRHQLAGSWRVAGVAMPAAPHLVPLAVGVLIAIAVLAWQNDLGMAAAIGLVAACYAAGAMWSRIGAALTMGTVFLAMSFAYVIVPRVRSRTDLWLDPWSAPTSGGYQFVQGDYALAGGGITGSPTMDIVARVPEFQTDFVLIAIGSRFGAGVAVATLCLIALLIVRCTVLALRARSELAKYIGVGMALMLGIQSILIIGGTLRLLPLTGLTAPLVSYGGTSMVVTLFALGVVMGLGAAPRRRMTAPLVSTRGPGAPVGRVHKPSRLVG